MTNNSKYFSQVEDIFKRETDSMDEYFNILEATMANSKKDFNSNFRENVNFKSC